MRTDFIANKKLFRYNKAILTCLKQTCHTEYPVEGCGYPGEPTNGQTSMSPDEKSNVGDVVTVDCEAGFELLGLSNRTCTTDGEWSGNFPTCSSKYRKKSH